MAHSSEAVEPHAVLALTVPWGACDPAQIVFYPNFFAWFDEATWHLFAGAGLTRDVLRARYAAAGFPLVRAGSEFRRQVSPGDRIAIETRLVRWGRSAFELRHTVREAAGRVAAEGFEIRVWAAEHDGRLRGAPIPDTVKALFAPR